MNYGDLDFTTQLEFALQIKKRLTETQQCYPQVMLNGMQFGSINQSLPIEEEEEDEDKEEIGLLSIRNGMKEMDEQNNVIYANDQDDVEESEKLVLGKHLVGVNEGKLTYLKEDGEVGLLDTKNHISHGKGGFAAFVMNKFGELLIFNHKDGDDKIKHSSFSNGENVVGAGELKITNGVLTHITVHSGHYKPSVNDISIVLKTLREQGLDVDDVKILTFKGEEYDSADEVDGYQGTVDNRYIQLVISDTIGEIERLEINGKKLTMKEKLAILNEMYDDYIGTKVASVTDLGLKKQIIANELFEQEEANFEDMMRRLNELL